MTLALGFWLLAAFALLMTLTYLVVEECNHHLWATVLRLAAENDLLRGECTDLADDCEDSDRVISHLIGDLLRRHAGPTR